MFIPVDLWFRAFLLTLVLELPIAALLLRGWEPDRVRLVLLITFANLASHPAVWFIFSQPFLIGTTEYIVAAEGWAVACEAVFYWAAFRGVPARRAIATALVANAASYAAGLLVARLWPDLWW